MAEELAQKQRERLNSTDLQSNPRRTWSFSWESPTATVPEAQLVDAVRRALNGEGDRQFPPAHLQELRAQEEESRRQRTLMPPE